MRRILIGVLLAFSALGANAEALPESGRAALIASLSAYMKKCPLADGKEMYVAVLLSRGGKDPVGFIEWRLDDEKEVHIDAQPAKLNVSDLKKGVQARYGVRLGVEARRTFAFGNDRWTEWFSDETSEVWPDSLLGFWQVELEHELWHAYPMPEENDPMRPPSSCARVTK
jgi:hypothetical protein